MEDFRIHDRLTADCHRLGRLEHCHLLLHRNAVLPWFILVPETQTVDVLDLPRDYRDEVIEEAALVSGFIKSSLGFPRVNFGAIGNLVPQLHLHVIGRRSGDACWPLPVWGHLEENVEYSEADISGIRTRLVESLRLNS